jgi:acyl transferase domain-containing protein
VIIDVIIADEEAQIPTTRFKVEQYSPFGSGNQAGNSRHMPTRHGNFLSDPHVFDHQFFNISPREAKSMDPQQKLLSQGALRALDDAGYVPNATPFFQTDTMGCYIGVATDDYVQNLMNDIDVYSSTG